MTVLTTMDLHGVPLNTYDYPDHELAAIRKQIQDETVPVIFNRLAGKIKKLLADSDTQATKIRASYQGRLFTLNSQANEQRTLATQHQRNAAQFKAAAESFKALEEDAKSKDATVRAERVEKQLDNLTAEREREVYRTVNQTQQAVEKILAEANRITHAINFDMQWMTTQMAKDDVKIRNLANGVANNIPGQPLLNFSKAY